LVGICTRDCSKTRLQKWRSAEWAPLLQCAFRPVTSSLFNPNNSAAVYISQSEDLKVKGDDRIPSHLATDISLEIPISTIYRTSTTRRPERLKPDLLIHPPGKYRKPAVLIRNDRRAAAYIPAEILPPVDGQPPPHPTTCPRQRCRCP
jgi:hypothetical protein